jgi:hypothetical protein
MKDVWLKAIPCYIDPALKNEEIYTQVQKDFSRLDLKSTVPDPSFFPLLYVTTSNTISDRDKLESKKDILVLNFEELNLNFFGSDEEIPYQTIELKRQYNWSNVSNLLDFFYQDYVEKFMEIYGKKSKKSLNLLEKRVREFSSTHKKSHTLPKELREYVLTLIHLEEAVFSSVSFEQAKQKITPFLIEEKIPLEVKFCNCSEVSEIDFETGYCLPLISKNKDITYIKIDTKEDFEWSDIVTYKIFYLYLDYLNKYAQERNFDLGEFYERWDEILQVLPYPFALFDKKGDLIKHNGPFIDFNITGKDCMALKDRQKISIDHDAYDVHRKEILINNEEHTLFFFHNSFLISEVDIIPSSEELGIVSSSIAHELNNPLAGIIAAIDVLLLDDHSEDIVQDLQEIKNGAFRCKQLVETFLGFSRARPEQFVNMVGEANKPKQDSTIDESLEQALNLIRFRLIENNIKLNHNFERINRYHEKINGSIFAMIFYLIFGEMLTVFSHYQLVSDSESSKTIDLVFKEDHDSFSIEFMNEYFKNSFKLDNKLISHLLDLENHDIHFDNSQLVFTARRQLSL